MALQCGDNQIPEFAYGIAVDQRGDNLAAALVSAIIAAVAAVTNAQAQVRQQVAKAGACPRRCPVKTAGEPSFDQVRFQLGFDPLSRRWNCAITGTVSAVVTCTPKAPAVEG